MAGTIEAEGDLTVDHLGFGAVHVTVTVPGRNPRTATRRSQSCAWRPSPAPTPAIALRCSPPQQATDAGQIGGGPPLSTRSMCAASRTPTATASVILPVSAPDCRTCGVWASTASGSTPFYPSPQHDHGYDVSDYLAVHPEYGTLECFDRLVHDAHRLDLNVLIDIVPNHCSTEHPWFAAALSAGQASPERERFHFADGRGEYGELPPNNWRSIFGGSAWQRVTESDGSPGQWYLHSFAPEQADFNWRHSDVAAYFEQVLRFWFERGVDGVRIDVAHGLHKADRLPDHENAMDDELTGDPLNPYAWNQPEVHQVWRQWRTIAEDYTARTGRERVLIGEVGVLDTEQLALYQRPDELHQSFYFDFLRAHWDDRALYDVVDRGLS